MIKNETCFIPNLTTNAGRCLTTANWQDVGTTIAAFDLTSLLMKPGVELLNLLPDVVTYAGWCGRVALNASMPIIDREGGCILRSEYDGSRRRYFIDEILVLIAKLKPELVILPQGIHQLDKNAWLSLPDTILPFFTPNCLPNSEYQRPYGVYLHYDAAKSFSHLLKQVEEHQGLPCYVSGDIDLPSMQMLVSKGVHYIESDLPAQNACQGLVYSDNAIISLNDNTKNLEFGLIDELCQCPTCEQKFTLAYLCHLFAHTPLLCQRFLIQHNIHYCHTSFTSA